MVGRAKTITGPYLDKDGNRMDQGGATLVLKGNKNWAGVGHNAAYTFNGTDYLPITGNRNLKLKKLCGITTSGLQYRKI